MDVDTDKVLKQNVDLGAVYQTLQTFTGGYFMNYFNNFGRQWQVFVQAEEMKYEEGLPLFEAALEGAKLHLRPILMTSFAFILGCVPLATASGAGGLSRQVMGYVVIGGMLAASFIAIFLIPVLFYLVEKFTGEKPHQKKSDTASAPAH